MKRYYNYIFILIMVLISSGCVSVQTTSLEKDNESKKFITNSTKSNVYLYRNESFGMAIGMPIIVDGKLAGKTGAKTYYNWQLEPGEHIFKSMTENTSRLILDTEAGKNYFIWQEVKMGLWSAQSKLQEVSAEIGEKGVMESKRLKSDF